MICCANTICRVERSCGRWHAAWGIVEIRTSARMRRSFHAVGTVICRLSCVPSFGMLKAAHVWWCSNDLDDIHQFAT